MTMDWDTQGRLQSLVFGIGVKSEKTTYDNDQTEILQMYYGEHGT